MTSVASNLASFDIDDLPDGACISPKRIFPECFKDGTCLYENVKVNLLLCYINFLCLCLLCRC